MGDGDGVCNQDEIVGCKNKDACNYNPTALPRLENDGDCIIPSAHRNCNGQGDLGDCDEGFVSDCSGNGKCVPQLYLGDSYLDCGGDSQYGGWDLSCYPE